MTDFVTIDSQNQELLTVPNFTFTQGVSATGENKIAFPSIKQYNVYGRLRIQFDFTSTNYFTNSPNGRFFVVGRNDNTLTDKYVGSGVSIGNMSAQIDGASVTPSIQSKTWYNGKHVDEDNQEEKLLPQFSKTALSNGVKYTVIIDLLRNSENNSLIRFQIVNSNTAAVVFSSTEIQDDNSFIDYTKTGIAFGHQNSSTSLAWTITFSDIFIAWAPSGIDFDTICYCPRQIRKKSTSSSFQLENETVFSISHFADLTTKRQSLSDKGVRDFDKAKFIRLENINVKLPEYEVVQPPTPGWSDVVLDVEVGGYGTIRQRGISFLENDENGLGIDKVPAKVQTINIYRGEGSQYYKPNEYNNVRLLLLDGRKLDFGDVRFCADPTDVYSKNIVVDFFIDFINQTFTFTYPSGDKVVVRKTITNNATISLNIPVDFGQSDCCDGEIPVPRTPDPDNTDTGDSDPNAPDPRKESFYITPSEVEPGQLFSSHVFGEPNTIFDAKFFKSDGTQISYIPGVPLDSNGRFVSGGNYPPASIGETGIYYAEIVFSASGKKLKYYFAVKKKQKPGTVIKDPEDLVSHYEDVVKNNIYAPVNQPMFNSLVSAAATMGEAQFKRSAISMFLNIGDYLSAATSFLKYIKDKNGKDSDKLKAQREKEMKQFLSDGYIDVLGEWVPAPSTYEKYPELLNRPQFYPNDPVGFCDPNKTYPKTPGEPDTNRLARQERIRETIVWKKEQAEHKKVPIANSEDTWDQAPSGYNAKYPNNKMVQTECGHLFELDDTPTSERIHLYHRKGTFWEIDNEGNSVRRTVGNDYQIVEHDGLVHIVGAANVCIGGATSVRIENTMNVEIHGTATVHMHENAVVKVAKDVELSVGRNVRAHVKGNVSGKIEGKVNLDVFQNVEVKSKADIKFEAGGNISMKAGGIIGADASGIWLNSGKSQSVTPDDIEIPQIYDKPYAPADTPAKTTLNRKEEAGAKFETPDEGTPNEVEAWKQKRIQEGTATRQELEEPPETKEKAGSTGGTAPKDVPVTVPTGREFRSDDKISKYFTLADMTDGYKRTLRNQSGVTAEQTFANLCYLATNVLDVLKEKYPNMKINSGYRLGESKSQHNKGEAVDISFPGLSRKDLYERIKEVEKLVPYDQMLLEYLTPGGNGWIHISLAKRTPRKQAFTMVNHKRISNFGEFVQVA